ncbi:VWA domain-containing protein [Mycolicibacterium porcinum]|uniref:VWA domain-containing protein n=1 Tax=Mycolicibacterium porcinum TaxID=39693 RepID=UPI001648F453|nr:VWA domain-containing protein [Mycolicibacterium porcinum]
MTALSLSGFQHRWFFLCALVAVGILALYVYRLRAKGAPVLRFANMDLLAVVAPRRVHRLKHVPAALLLTSILLLTVALADPTRDHLIPRDRAVVMLVIDVSESMSATDVAPDRLTAAKEAGKKFVDGLNPSINLGLVAFAGTATLLVPPTTKRTPMKAAIDRLAPAERTATGEGIYTALQAIATVSDVIGGGDGPPPARIVLESDGKETVPLDPDQPRGAFAAARAAHAQGVPISAISFGTPDGYVTLNDQKVAVPVDDQTLQEISKLSGDGRVFHADTMNSLEEVYGTLQQQIGFQLVPADASAGWLILATLTLACAALAGLSLNRRLPG